MKALVELAISFVSLAATMLAAGSLGGLVVCAIEKRRTKKGREL